MKNFLLLTVFLISSSGYSDAKGFYSQRLLNSRSSAPFLSTVTTGYFDQAIDHENPLETFKQRYYYDMSFASDKDAPVLFYICGEATCRESSLSGHVKTLAKKYNAVLLALEHRYYGVSQPFPDLSTENLRFLSTKNALIDLEKFQRFFTNKMGLTGKWVAVGGSYPGNLAAFYRLKYPHLVVGALASSAPVFAKEEFFEYDRHVSEVAGPQCLDNMKAVVRRVEGAISNPAELKLLKDELNASEIKSDLDFLYLIAEIAAAAIQYGERDKLCSEISESDPVKGYIRFAKYLFSAWQVEPVDFTFQSAESLDPNSYLNGFGMRQWLYQSCTEYGYWQVANQDRNQSHRSELIDLDFHRNTCKRLFNIDTPAATESMNLEYYKPLLQASTSNILFTNGSEDPWSVLSITENTEHESDIQVFGIEAAAHCDDLHKGSRSDSESLREARRLFSDLLELWLEN